jgi:hypothetical protein
MIESLKCASIDLILGSIAVRLAGLVKGLSITFVGLEPVIMRNRMNARQFCGFRDPAYLTKARRNPLFEGDEIYRMLGVHQP